jgi:VWFA-related protein
MNNNSAPRLWHASVLIFCALATAPFPTLTALASDGAVPAQVSDILVLKKTVRRVVVDVVVRDSDGKPVHGLTAKDFTVSEDQKPQKVLSFDVHNLDSTSLSLPATAALPPNVFVNVPKHPEKGSLFIILFDMVNIDENSDQIWARQEAIKFIKSKPAGTRFAIFVHSDFLHMIQGFTDDKDLLYAALDPNNPRPHFPKVFLMARNFREGSDQTVAMISVLTHIASFLNGVPGRKNLIWMSNRFPVSLYATSGTPPDFQEDVRREFDELTRAQIALYPVLCNGVQPNPPGALNGAGPRTGVGGASPDTAPIAMGSPSGSSGPAPLVPGKNADVRGDFGSLAGLGTYYGDRMIGEGIAKATGGRMLGSNDLKADLNEIVEDGSNYYTLTYSPTNSNYDGSLRQIRVEIEGSKYKLQYRRSYYADDPESTPVKYAKKRVSEEDTPDQLAEKEEARPLVASLQHGAPLVHQLIFKARIHAVGNPTTATPEQMAKLADQPAFSRGKHKNGSGKGLKPVQVQTYAVYYLVVASQIKLERGGSIPLEFAAVAYDPDGRVLNGVVEKVQNENSFGPAILQAPPPESWEPGHRDVYRAMQEFDVPVNATSMRLAVRDTYSDRVGAIEVPLPLAPEPDTQATTPGTSSLNPVPEARSN